MQKQAGFSCQDSRMRKNRKAAAPLKMSGGRGMRKTGGKIAESDGRQVAKACFHTEMWTESHATSEVLLPYF